MWNGSAVLGPKDKLVVGHGFMKYVAQEFDLMPFTTVSENIGTHLSNFYPNEKEKRIKELLKVVDLEEFSSTKVKLLSGGQKQRVSIARALIKKPEIMVFDDCLSAVDTETEEIILRNIKAATQDVSSLIVAHRISSVKHCDQIICLEDGRVIERGTAEELEQAGGHYTELVALQLDTSFEEN